MSCTAIGTPPALQGAWDGKQLPHRRAVLLHDCVQDFGVSRHDGGWVQFHVGLWNRKGLGQRVALKPILQEVQIDMMLMLFLCLHWNEVALHRPAAVR